jgi:hypothetical protein
MSQLPSIPIPSPLNQLYVPDPRYNYTNLRFPENLDHIALNGHYINFYINVHTSSKYYKDPNYTYTPAPGAGGGSYFAIPNAGNGGNVIGGPGLGFSISNKMNQRINQAISLYVPDSVGFSHQIQYGVTSLMEFGKTLMKAAANEKNAAGTRSAAQNVMQKMAMRAIQNVGSVVNSDILTAAKDVAGVMGYAINPQLLVLFRGISFRHFQFDFVFSPRNENEAASVRNIIKAFRFHSSPEIATDLGVFYIAPSTFDIEFLHKSHRNTNVNMIKTCVLTNYSVDYAPYGWSTHIDGMPIQTTLSLQFQETEIVVKSDIELGY